MLLPPHRQVRRSHRSIHCWHGHAARRSALPRERFSPMARNGPEQAACRRLLSGVEGTSGASGGTSAFDPLADLRDLQKSGGFWMSLSIRPVQGHRLNKILTTHSVDPTILTGM